MLELKNGSALASRIRLIVAKSKLTHGQFAAKLGIPVERLRSLVYGKVKRLTSSEQRQFNVRFRVPMRFLATGEGAAAKPRASVLPPGLTTRQQQLVNDILVGIALRDTDSVRSAIERYVADELGRPARRATAATR